VVIRAIAEQDHDDVVALWERCGLVVPWNDPRRDIARKLAEQPDLFLVVDSSAQSNDRADGSSESRLIGTVMVGYDGHRGWSNYLAVDPSHRGKGVGRALMEEAERLLRARGCPKINLQVRKSNTDVVAFYERIGFRVDDVLSMGRRLEDDERP